MRKRFGIFQDGLPHLFSDRERLIVIPGKARDPNLVETAISQEAPYTASLTKSLQDLFGLAKRQFAYCLMALRQRPSRHSFIRCPLF
jgi:hypothetical protein